MLKKETEKRKEGRGFIEKSQKGGFILLFFPFIFQISGRQAGSLPSFSPSATQSENRPLNSQKGEEGKGGSDDATNDFQVKSTPPREEEEKVTRKADRKREKESLLFWEAFAPLHAWENLERKRPWLISSSIFQSEMNFHLFREKKNILFPLPV